MECEFCKVGAETLFNNREISRYHDSVYSGIEVELDNNGMIYILAVLDEQHCGSLVGMASIPINFCPMCGRDLSED